MLRGAFLGCGLLAARDWSGDLLLADFFEDLQKSEAVEMHVKRFKSQCVFVKSRCSFLSASGTAKPPDSTGSLPPAEDNLE